MYDVINKLNIILNKNIDIIPVVMYDIIPFDLIFQVHLILYDFVYDIIAFIS
jgi:hypothetical protein